MGLMSWRSVLALAVLLPGVAVAQPPPLAQYPSPIFNGVTANIGQFATSLSVGGQPVLTSASSSITSLFSSPSPIGSVIPNTGAFTTLTLSARNIDGGVLGANFVGGGPITTNNGINITKSIAPAGGAIVPPISWSLTPSGTTNSTQGALINISTSSDTIALPAVGSTLFLTNISYAFGGSTMIGSRFALSVKSTQTAKSGNRAADPGAGTTSAGPFYQGVQFAHQQNDTEGGTSTGQIGSYGQVFAGGSIIRTLAAATNLHEVSNWEFDMNTVTPSYKKFGVKVTQLPTDTGQGALDGAFVIEQGGNPSLNGWHSGFLAIEPNGGFPYASDGCILCAPLSADFFTVPNTMRKGVDLHEVLFTGHAFRSRGMSIDAAGTLNVGNGYLAATAGGVSLDASGSVGPAEGVTISGAALVSGGTGGRANNLAMYDPYGGVYNISAVSGGVVTQLTVLRTPYFASATPPANPVTLTDSLSVFGNVTGTVQITAAWTQPNVVSVAASGGPVVMAGLPTSAPVTHCALWRDPAEANVIKQSVCP
jgi:hypothetical protein